MIGFRLSLHEPPSPLGRTLGPVSSLRELLAVAEASLSGHGLANGSDRGSLAGDCQAALDSIGPALRRHLGPRLQDFRKTTLARLGPLLGEPAGARRVAQASTAMLAAIREQGAAFAAWDDCIQSFNAGSDPRHICEIRVTQLREVEQARGHDWEQHAVKLADLIRDDDLPFARDLAALPPTANVTAVWVAFDNAHVSEGSLHRGPVQFFDSGRWPDAARNTDPATGKLWAPELDDATIAKLRTPTVNGHFVWCRVTVSGPGAIVPHADVPRVPAHERARELACAVVEAATFQLGGSKWRLQAGALLVLSDGSTEMHDHFEDPVRRRAARQFRSPTSDPTSGALGDIDDGFVHAVAAGLSHAQEAVSEVRWYEAAEAALDPAQRLALHVRALEHALPIVDGETWTDPVRRYLREHWTHDRLNRVVFDLGHGAADELRHLDPALIEQCDQFLVWDDPADRQSFTLSYASLVKHAATIADRLPGRMWHLRRALRELHTATATHAATLLWLEDLGQEFDTLLRRSVRQRNAIVHGIPTHRPVVDSVVDFVAQLSAYVVAQTVHRVASQRDPLAEFELGRAEALMTRSALRDEARPVWQILWTPREDPGF